MVSEAESVSRKPVAPAGEPLRLAVQVAAKRFKSSWVEFGRLLAKVRNEALWEDWGYARFETYCLSELRIRKGTAEKLTRNFGFLEKHEPDRVKDDDIVQTAPAFEVVEVLAQAEERGQLSAAEYRSVRDSIWNQDKPVAEVRREVADRFPPPPPEPLGEAEGLRRLWSAAKKLAAELRAAQGVPRATVEQAQALAAALEVLVARKSDA
jgi:hypothetical protein